MSERIARAHRSEFSAITAARIIRRAVGLVGVFAATSQVAQAQGNVMPAAVPQKPQTRSIASIADSMTAKGDSARALAMLDSAVHKNPKDGAAWNRYGLLAWSKVRLRRSANYMSDQRDIKSLLVADSALRLATQLSPDSAQFWLDLSQFSLTSGYASMRFSASGHVSHALTAAEHAGDSIRVSKAADEHGLFAWRRYEAQGNRALNVGGQNLSISQMSANFRRDNAKEYIDQFAHKIEPPTGQGDFNDAVKDFTRATRADPTSLRASRHVFMALAEKKQWQELRDEAKRRIKLSDYDYQAWLALGLASHRLGDEHTSGIAFDSAFKLTDEDTRERYNRLTRILRPVPTPEDKKAKKSMSDSATFMNLDEGERRAREAFYWVLSDPLARTPENEHRLEFLSRVTFSEFRWTNEDFNLNGADTDRGDIYVRYGPPDVEMTVAGTSEGLDGGVTLVWMYTGGFLFFFDTPPGFGTARFAFNDRYAVDQIKAAQPVNFNNVPITKTLDTIPVRITAFRATTDSLDVVVAGGIPMDSLIHGLDVAGRLPVDVDVRVYDQHASVRGIESTQTSVAPDSAMSRSQMSWRRRVGPGYNLVRVEAVQPDTKRAARATSTISDRRESGFGMSDILLGSKPTAREGVANVERWSDLDVTPSVGIFKQGTPIGLAWEEYDVSGPDGQAKYQVRVQVERTSRTGAVGFAARLLDGVGQTLGRDAKNNGRLSIGYPRTVQAKKVIVEYMTLDMSSAPTGDYVLNVQITDLTTKKVATRRSSFSITK